MEPDRSQADPFWPLDPRLKNSTLWSSVIGAWQPDNNTQIEMWKLERTKHASSNIPASIDLTLKNTFKSSYTTWTTLHSTSHYGNAWLPFVKYWGVPGNSWNREKPKKTNQNHQKLWNPGRLGNHPKKQIGNQKKTKFSNKTVQTRKCLCLTSSNQFYEFSKVN